MLIDFSKIITAESQAEALAVEAARALLIATDHEVIKAVETGQPMPPGLSERRAQARALVRAAKGRAASSGGDL